MRFVNGICLECKHELQIDTTKITATCPFCGSLYDVEETIKKRDNVLSELKENNKIKKLYHDVEKGVSVRVRDNIQLCINTTNNIVGYILLIQISNKEKEVLNTYYLEARDKNYVDLKPTLEKLNRYGHIDLYIKIKISTEKNKNSEKYTYSYNTYNYSDWIDFESVSLYREKPIRQRESFDVEYKSNAALTFACGLMIIIAIVFVGCILPFGNMNYEISDSSNSINESINIEEQDKIGINIYYSDNEKRFKILNIENNSAGEKAGLMPGDTILSIDGFDISGKQDLANMLENHVNKAPYTYVIDREGIEKTIKISCNAEEADVVQEIEIQESQQSEKQDKSNTDKDKIGVSISLLASGRYIITGVEKDSPAENAGIKSGDIIISIDGIEIHEEADLKTVLLRHKTGNPYTYIINSNGADKKLTVSTK
ncbi:MAG: PDZ domain-containing protein [Clostridia bacterium]|jgi:uncharacterized metal-binding protein/DNA-directed RNA polymerase subunit RPC12/RpoP